MIICFCLLLFSDTDKGEKSACTSIDESDKDGNQHLSQDTGCKTKAAVVSEQATFKSEKPITSSVIPSPDGTPSDYAKVDNPIDSSGDREGSPVSSGCQNGKSEPILTTVKDEGTGTRSDDDDSVNESKVPVILKSQKMIGLKDLLICEKLNTSAIQLQLTAQSQVYISKRPRVGSFTSTKHHSEFDFLATTTIATSLAPTTPGSRASKRTRRD